MTVHNTHSLTLSVTAAEDLSTTGVAGARFKAITLAGTVVPTATAAGASARAIGINITSARSGDQATAVVAGITKVMAGAAVSTLGFPIMVGSLGFMFAASSGFSHVGRALEIAASGDLFKAIVNFDSLPLWSGA